ncbi:hypothetical protein [Streptomyces ardesiacus]|uniref:hypothetical protein n=1 Tax=Streptomyces ardesiacus TaxID=285564 RepID=UPI0033D622BF
MATVIEPRPLADLEQDAIARVDDEMARRGRGLKPWTTREYVERIEHVHICFNWLRRREQETAA